MEAAPCTGRTYVADKDEQKAMEVLVGMSLMQDR